MSSEIEEDNLRFNFEFNAIKFDDTQYYKKHFQGIKNNIQAVDILAVNDSIGYLIEIKDYTYPDTKNLTQNELIETMVSKVVSTLSVILPMKNNASVIEEKEIAKIFSRTEQIRIIFHIEKPPKRRTLKQSTYNFQKMEIALKGKLKPIDAHPKVVSKENLKGLPWTVTKI